MDPLPTINIKKDSSFAMMLAAQKAGWEIHTMYQQDIYAENEIPRAFSRTTIVDDNTEKWFTIISQQDIELASLDISLLGF